MLLTPGDIVRLRSRLYLVDRIESSSDPAASQGSVVSLTCLEDDAQGETLDVLWECELDAQRLQRTSWDAIASRGFDSPRHFAAFFRSLRWSSVTSTDPKLFQAPYRAGIEVKSYQLEPLRLALSMPRTNLFIADDVGLGKTIEAGLILREMILRQKVRRCLICVPPSVLRQWRDEMEERFGLSFQIYDRDHVSRIRQERGWAINPWTTHSRFLLSHALIRDEAYAAPLRDWLSSDPQGSLLILDEAHHAAPSSSSKYAIDSKLTRSIREIAPLFEHRLFLSATPHNGHSNSFSALLEILDPQRFCRGVPVDPKLRDQVLIRRLKSDLRSLGEAFPKRQISRIVLDQLPPDSPEILLSHLLQEYRKLREARLASSSSSQRTAALLVLTSLQKRLLSSIHAFARTLAVHRRALDSAPLPSPPRDLDLLLDPPDADHDLSDLDESLLSSQDDAQIQAATSFSHLLPLSSEIDLLQRMTEIAQASHSKPDPRVLFLLAWIKQHLCPNLGQDLAPWNPRRLLIFTEYADTKNYLHQQLSLAIASSHLAPSRLRTFHGGISDDQREAIKLAFNTDPLSHPLRILIATDAAREGVNLQNHCHDLFHFDIPWNPGRLEQRIGRLDRKLQKADTVTSYYFVLPQRPEDRVLDILVQKTRTIHEELGSLSPVLERKLHDSLRLGIPHSHTDSLLTSLQSLPSSSEPSRLPSLLSDLGHDDSSERLKKLERQIQTLQKLLHTSKSWIGLDESHFRDALSVSLQLLGRSELSPLDPSEALRDPDSARWLLPPLLDSKIADPTWLSLLDSLRPPRKKNQSLSEWRSQHPPRPVVFRDPGNLDSLVVHLHLEHRVVQRLLSRFLSMGFRDDSISRACVLLSDLPEPTVALLGRLSLFGPAGSRLHDQILATASLLPPSSELTSSKLRPLKLDLVESILSHIDDSLSKPHLHSPSESQMLLLQASAPLHISQLSPHLERRASSLLESATSALQKRAHAEASAMRDILIDQEKRILLQRQKLNDPSQLSFSFSNDEIRQLQADRKHWDKRLSQIESEKISEPQRILDSYSVKAHRIEPLGLIYLLPRS